jgi:hypothetical protein
VDLDANWGTKFPLSELDTPLAPSYSMHSARDVKESNNTSKTAVPLDSTGYPLSLSSLPLHLDSNLPPPPRTAASSPEWPPRPAACLPLFPKLTSSPSKHISPSRQRYSLFWARDCLLPLGFPHSEAQEDYGGLTQLQCSQHPRLSRRTRAWSGSSTRTEDTWR